MPDSPRSLPPNPGLQVPSAHGVVMGRLEVDARGLSLVDGRRSRHVEWDSIRTIESSRVDAMPCEVLVVDVCVDTGTGFQWIAVHEGMTGFRTVVDELIHRFRLPHARAQLASQTLDGPPTILWRRPTN